MSALTPRANIALLSGVIAALLGGLAARIWPEYARLIGWSSFVAFCGVCYWVLRKFSDDFHIRTATNGHGVEVATKLDSYSSRFSEKTGKGTVGERKAGYADMTSDFYDLVTDIYHMGWGDSFHFAPRFTGEGFIESVRKDEYWLAHQGEMKKGQRWLDLGCGIAGPLTHIARFSEANITGVTINKYQVFRGREKIEKEKLSELCSVEHCDFMKLKERFGANSVDGAYAIEATCHAPDKVKCFKAIYDVLKPGGVFVAYEWAVTDKYDPKNPKHREIKFGIESHNALPELATEAEIVEALEAAGFVVEAHEDRTATDSKTNDIPWYASLDASYSLANWPSSQYGQIILRTILRVMELVKLAPKGCVATHEELCRGLVHLVNGGKTGTFSPHLFVKARKPFRQ